MSWGSYDSGAVGRQHEFTRNMGKLIAFARMPGYGLSFGHTFRRFEEQEELYQGGSSKTLDSQHLHGLAVDIYVYLDDRLYRLRESPENIST